METMKIRLSVIAAAALLAGCTQELAPVTETAPSKTAIQVSINATKTYMGDLSAGVHKVYWSNGDMIAVNGTASDALDGLADNTATAEFTFASAPTAPFNAVYPASIYTDASHVTLPTTQTYKSGNFADGMNPMAGYSAGGDALTMSHLCAIVKVSVKRSSSDPADEDKLLAVRFKGRNSEQVCGLFEIDYENATLTGESSAAEDKEVRVIQSLETSTSTAAVYYVVVPAGTYSNGFDVTVQDAKGHIQTKSVTSSKALEAGHLYNMPEFEFVPTGTELGITISSAQDMIDFATAYNNKEYDALGSALVASLTTDITFDATSSAAFNATGGIGLKEGFGDAEDYYFNGYFFGNNHSISGLDATVPIFKAAGGAAHIKDFTIEDDCTFTFTHPNTGEFDFGAAVGYLKGELNNVSVDADVALAAGDIAQVTALGGITGRITEGKVIDCSYSGNISVPDDFSVSAKKTYLGGISGTITNTNGKVLDSTFEGTIDFAGKVSSSDKTNPYLMIGGIIGSSVGTVSNCNTLATNTKTITMDNSKDYTASIQNHSRLAYHIAQGGIVGMNGGTVSDCTNGASIKNYILSNGVKDGTASDSNSRYYDLGGIVGLNLADAIITGCSNNALIESRCTPRIQKIGGVVGYNKGEVSSCNNTAEGDIYITTTNISPYSVRVGEIGGVIGNHGGTVASDIQNAGDIHLDRTENAAGVEMKMGGVIGLATSAIDGGGSKNISNTGAILNDYNGTTVTTAGLRFGGVVGSAQASVQNVTNSGSVTYKTTSTNIVSKLSMGGIVGELRGAGDAQVSGCQNGGEVFFNVANNAAHTDNYVGGIIGKTIENIVDEVSYPTNLTISNCTNTGYIHGGNSSKQNGTTLYVGGIIAYLDGVSSISDCVNNGTLWNNQFNNTNTKVGSTFEGGIAGFVIGTEDDRITITNVENDVDDGATVTGPRRGYSGGAVGYAEYADITNATNKNSYGGGSGYWIGGIGGWIVNSTISNSTYSGTSIESSQIQGAGGIVCVLDAGSTLDNCSSHLASITHGANPCVDGDVAGKSVETSTIKNCHYTGTYGICSDTNFTDGGGNAADL